MNAVGLVEGHDARKAVAVLWIGTMGGEERVGKLREVAWEGKGVVDVRSVVCGVLENDEVRRRARGGDRLTRTGMRTYGRMSLVICARCVGVSALRRSGGDVGRGNDRRNVNGPSVVVSHSSQTARELTSLSAGQPSGACS